MTDPLNNTLRDYIKQTDEAHDRIEKFAISLNVEQLEKEVRALQTNIKNIQAVAKRMADVSNIINQVILYKKKINKTYIDPYPTENDHATLRAMYPHQNEHKLLIENCAMPVRVVNLASEIPIQPLYYINEYKQYAICINGVIIRGNLANISPYQTERTSRCEYGIKCKMLLDNQPCKYYHDPDDYIKLNRKIPVDETMTRNFTAGSWIYSTNKKPTTYFTRHVGSKDTLVSDLHMLRKIQYREEVHNREGQLIHDLLIYMILHNKGLLERYPQWG